MIRDVLRLKDEHLESPDPLRWTAEVMWEVITESIPAHLPEGIGMPEAAAADLMLLVTFLWETGQWRKHPLRSADAQLLLATIAWPDPAQWVAVDAKG